MSFGGISTSKARASSSATSTAPVTKLIVEPLGRWVCALKS
jgi:hypothetical protein